MSPRPSVRYQGTVPSSLLWPKSLKCLPLCWAVLLHEQCGVFPKKAAAPQLPVDGAHPSILAPPSCPKKFCEPLGHSSLPAVILGLCRKVAHPGGALCWGFPTILQEIIKTLITIHLYDNKCFKCFLFLVCCEQIRGCMAGCCPA